ncbi:MAG: molybdenum cofactor biosynthesis protein A [Candidatus Dadabacteria bacterium]|nr:MAG: molybdenum cofactor biosynthesis protein A [Candidatus Dadabacteria bacterium]
MEAIRDIPVTLRFIELMKTASAQSIYLTQYVPLSPFKDALIKDGWREIQPSPTSGPAKEFTHPDFKCKVGFITPYSENFCKTCNKLRVDSRGNLHLCLFNSSPYPLRDLLQNKDQQPALEKKIISLVRDKHFSELLLNSSKTPVKSLSVVGG